MQELKSWIAGHWVSGEPPSVQLINPTTAEPLATACRGGVDFRAALRFARGPGRRNLASLSYRQRGELLALLAKRIHSIRDELIAAEMDNMGSTRSDAKFDIDGASGTLMAYAFFAKNLPGHSWLADGDPSTLTRSKRFLGRHVWMLRRGVAVHINAFNFPAWGMCEKLAAALLAGMPVITKPATSTALTAFRIIENFAASGLIPEGALQLVCGSIQPLMDELEGQDCIAFTGSASTAAKIRSHPRIVERAVRLNIEADSINAAAVGPDVEPGSETFQLAVREVVREIRQKAGQKCTATRRIIVPEPLVEPFSNHLVEALESLVVGDPHDSRTEMGPLSAPGQMPEVLDGFQQFADSYSCITGGDRVPSPHGVASEHGYFVLPTLYLATRNDGEERVHKQEIFGPVSTIIPYDGSAGEAGELIRRGEGSLVTTIYSDDAVFNQSIWNEIAPYQGRVLFGDEKIADHSTGPGMVLPALIHGGPGRAGGGEELGGVRGLKFYLQRVAIQASSGMLKRLLGDE